MRIKSSSTGIGISLAVSLLALQACTSDQLPTVAQLRIMPDSREISIVEVRDEQDRCIVNPGNHVDLPLVFAFNDIGQAPIGEAELSVYADFAENTYSGYPALKIYRDINGNGVVDGEAEYISGIDDSVAVIKTGKYTGQQSILLRVNLSCAFRGEVFAFAGQATASSAVTVTAVNSHLQE